MPLIVSWSFIGCSIYQALCHNWLQPNEWLTGTKGTEVCSGWFGLLDFYFVSLN